MKAFSSLALLLGLFFALLTPPHARADEEVSFDYFYDALAPYGTWVEVEGYGPCWSPSEVDADWAPYTEGQWVYTDAGWTWVGDEVFAGIVYHYGRWIFTNTQGWCWVPGYEWGPGWVSWRDNDEYIGWAPLPPEVVWEQDQGVGVWVDEVYNIGPSYYSFCHHRDFGHRHLRSVIMARSWNTTIIVQTVNITNITFNRSSGVAFCGGLNYDRACRFTGVTIPALRLERRHDFDFRGDHRRGLLPAGQIQGSTLAIVAPRIRGPQDKHEHGPKTTKVISQNQVQRGWTGKGASGDLDSVRRKMQMEVHGSTPKTAPARKVAERDLQMIPRAAVADSPVTPAQPTIRPALPATTVPENRRGMAVQPIPPQPATPPQPVVQIPERSTAIVPFNQIPQPSRMQARDDDDRPQQVNPRSNTNNNNTNGLSPIEAYQQRQRAENAARNLAEKQRMQELQVRQQNEAAEEARQQALLQQRQQAGMERQRQATFQQQQQAAMERQKQANIQQQQQAAMEHQRQERAQMQAAAAAQQEQQRQRQQQAENQRQQQAASMARERERQSEMQRRTAPPTVSQPPIQTPSNRDSVRRSDDNDDRRRKR